MTMSFKKLGKGATAGNYYLNAATVDDYYLNDGVSEDPETMREPPGTWFDPSGSLPMDDAHGAKVDASDFQALLAGYDPTTGEALVRGAGEGHVAGYDFTFSAPKGVSAIWSQLPLELRAEIDAAQAAATNAALQYMSDKAGIARRGAGGAIKENVSIMAAVWPHGSSRENDPQIHTHSVVLNIARCEDGTYRTIDVETMLRWQSATASVYHTELAAQLMTRLGIRCEVKNGEFVFDAADVPQAVKDAWSKRAQQIAEAIADKGDVSKAMLDKASIETRDSKGELTRAQLLEIWHAQGKEYGFTEAEARDCLNVAVKPEITREDLVNISQDALNMLTRSQSVFSEAHLAAAIGVRMQGRGVAADIDKAVEALKEAQGVVLLENAGDNSLAMFSTPQMIELERDMVLNAKEETPQHALQKAFSERAIAERTGISEEQAAAVRHVCNDPHRVSIMEGSAGSGKTFSLAAVKDAYKEAGYNMHLLALSWSAAGVLSAEIKEKNARAIEGFVRDIESGKIALDNKSVVIVDEAGLVGSRHMSKIIAAAKQADAKVILTGDSLQLAPVDAGGAMAALVEECGGARIDEVRRQGSHVRNDPEKYASFAWQREAVLQFAHGDAAKALQAYDAAGCVHFADNHEAAIKAMVEDWKAGREANPNSSQLLLAVDNKSVKELNNQIRAYLKEQGALHGDAVKLQASDMRRAAEAEFAVGDQIMFRMNDREMGIVGDNDEQRQGVFNRTQGTIRGINHGPDGVPNLQIELAQGGVVEIRAGEGGYWDKERGGVPIQHAYATTVYASQGMTMDRVYCLDSLRLDRKSAYVAGSRHRVEFHTYASRETIHDRMMSRAGADEYRSLAKMGDGELLEAMAKTWSRAGDKVTTLQYLDLDGKPRAATPTVAARPVAVPTGGEKRAVRQAQEDFAVEKQAARNIDLPAWLKERGYGLAATNGGNLQLSTGKPGETWTLFQSRNGGNWLARQEGTQRPDDAISLVQKLENAQFRDAVTKLSSSGVGPAKGVVSISEVVNSAASRARSEAHNADLPKWLAERGTKITEYGKGGYVLRQGRGEPTLRLFQSSKAGGAWLVTDGKNTMDTIAFVQQFKHVDRKDAIAMLAPQASTAAVVMPKSDQASKIPAAAVTRAREIDMPAWLGSNGYQVQRDGVQFKLQTGQGETLRLFKSRDETWLATDGSGSNFRNPIQLVQDMERVNFTEAVERLVGPQIQTNQPQPNPVLPPAPKPQAPAAPISVRMPTPSQEAAGRAYLESRGISESTRKEAERQGFVVYDDRGPVFAGRDGQGAIRSAETRFIQSQIVRGESLTKMSYAGSDKTWSPVLRGDMGNREVHLVEGGVDALALREMHRRDSKPAPTIVVTGGANTTKWQDNPDVAKQLKEASRVVIHKENERGADGKPDPVKQQKTDTAHQKQAEAVAQVRGKPEGIAFERPAPEHKDLAEANKAKAAEAEAKARAAAEARARAEEEKHQSFGPR